LKRVHSQQTVRHYSMPLRNGRLENKLTFLLNGL
jgi:hypothetical protein